ncbi:MAG: type II secretion system F family protein [Elusimicrobiota bacterium]
MILVFTIIIFIFSFRFVYLRHKTKIQREKIDQELPFFLELLSMGLWAGFNIDKAWKEASQYLVESPLKKMLDHIELSSDRTQTRADILKQQAVKFEGQTFGVVCLLIVHALERGSSVELILNEMASQMRMERFIHTEKEIQLISLKMLLPLFLFIVPSVIIILMGPILIQLMTGSLFK